MLSNSFQPFRPIQSLDVRAIGIHSEEQAAKDNKEN
jgi:hypothetical protein